ncbi:UNVERIFIED_CONTAM: hypothetical protein FKN15_052202 [Acipenser sinensis]
MSGNISATANGFNLNKTTDLGIANRELHDAAIEFKVFNITITSLALCILTLTGIFCSFSYHNRRRQFRQARVYENIVAHEKEQIPVHIKGVKRTHSFQQRLSLMRKQDTYKDSSQIYFIYSNPIAVTEEDSSVMLEEDQIPFQNMTLHGDKLSDTDQLGGVIQDPSTFYMQL